MRKPKEESKEKSKEESSKRVFARLAKALASSRPRLFGCVIAGVVLLIFVEGSLTGRERADAQYTNPFFESRFF